MTPFTLAEVSAIFFVMMGPLRVVGAFAGASAGLERFGKIRLALRVGIMSTVALLLAAFAGSATLAKWNVSSAAVLFAAGLTLLFVSIGMVVNIRLFASQGDPPIVADQTPASRASRVFAAIVTPFGIATLLTFVSLQPGAMATVIAAFLSVMVANLLVMLFADVVVRYLGSFLAFIGQILSVLQVALAIEMIIGAFRLLGT